MWFLQKDSNTSWDLQIRHSSGSWSWRKKKYCCQINLEMTLMIYSFTIQWKPDDIIIPRKRLMQDRGTLSTRVSVFLFLYVILLFCYFIGIQTNTKYIKNYLGTHHPGKELLRQLFMCHYTILGLFFMFSTHMHIHTHTYVNNTIFVL